MYSIQASIPYGTYSKEPGDCEGSAGWRLPGIASCPASEPCRAQGRDSSQKKNVEVVV